MRKGLTRVCLVGIALSALLASGCVTGGSSGDDEVFNSGGDGSTTTIYDVANGDLASGGVVIGDGGGPRSPGPGSGIPQPFGPTTGGNTAGTSGGTSAGTTGGTPGTSGGSVGTTGGGGTSGGAAGTSGGSPPPSFTNFLYIPNDSGPLSILGATSAGALSFINPSFPTPGRASNLGVRPNGQTIYFPSFDTNQIQAYSVDQTTGNLTTLGGPVATGSLPERVIVSPNGSFAYVANSGSFNISQYAVATDGQLTSISAPIPLNTPGATIFSTIGIEPNSDHVYALASTSLTNGNIEIFNTPANDGVLNFATSVPAPPLPGQIVFTRGATPTGFAYVSSFTGGNIRAYARNGGGLTPLTPTADFPAGGFGTNDLLIHPSLSVLYALNTSSGATSLAFFTINPTSGALSAPTNINIIDPSGMAITQNGAFLYVWKDDNTIDTFALNSTTGAPTFQQTFSTPGLSLPNDGVGVPPVLQRRVTTP